MRDLIGQTLAKFISADDFDEVTVLIIRAQQLLELSEEKNLLLNASIIDFSHNGLTELAISQAFRMCPKVWWVNFSHNNVSSLRCAFPIALGSLNIVNNPISKADISNLKDIHILRLKALLPEETNIRDVIQEHLPNVWVLNNDFISHTTRSSHVGNVSSSKRGSSWFEYGTKSANNLTSASIFTMNDSMADTAISVPTTDEWYVMVRFIVVAIVFQLIF